MDKLSNNNSCGHTTGFCPRETGLVDSFPRNDDDDDDLYFALFTLNLHYICRSKL